MVAHKKELQVKAFECVLYALEVMSYSNEGNHYLRYMGYQTDLVITESVGEDADAWKPRVVIESKIKTVTTHDVITYSQKALTTVHPHLRYGILLGNRTHDPLPGRLFRHGALMSSWAGFHPTEEELNGLADIIKSDIKASRMLEESIYSSRSPNRERYTFLHRPLKLY